MSIQSAYSKTAAGPALLKGELYRHQIAAPLIGVQVPWLGWGNPSLWCWGPEAGRQSSHNHANQHLPLQPCDRTPTGSRRGQALYPRPPRTSHPTLAHPLALPTSSSSTRAASLGPIRLLLLQSSSPHRDTLPLQFWLPRGSGYEWEAAGPKAELPGLAQSTGHWGLLLTPAQRRHSRPLPVSLGLPAKHCTVQATGLPQPNVPPPAPFCSHYLL